ncbi:hypothetical protein Tco_0468861 [Tanacetum coccineum]
MVLYPKHTPAGSLLVWYVIRVATLRALVRAGDKTSEDARSWYKINGDAKSWVIDCSAYIHCVLLSESSRVPVPLPDDPYVAVRQTQLVDTDTESDPEEAPSEVEELQSVGSRVPLIGEEFEVVEPSSTRTDSSHSSSSSDYNTPLSPDHPPTHVSPTPTPTRALFHRRTTRITVCVQPAMSPGHSARVTEEMVLSDSAFYTDSEGDELGDEDIEGDESLDEDDEGERSDDEGLGSDDEVCGLEGEGLGLKKDEEATHEGQQQAVLVMDTAASEPLCLGYGAARHRALESIEEIAHSTYEVDPEDDRVYTDIPVYPLVAPVQTPLSLEWSSGSLPISLSSPIVPSPIASPVATPTVTISIDED